MALFEVLSPSTENYNRGKKFNLYQEIESPTDYMMLHWDELWVEHYHRQGDGTWLPADYPGPEAEFESSPLAAGST